MTQTLDDWSRILERRDVTIDEILKLQDLGFIGEDDNFELIDGEVVPMQSKTHRHELIKSFLILAIARALPDHLWLGVESSMYLSQHTLLEPDLVVYRRGIELEQVRGPDIVLAVEVALTTLGFDLGRKAALYAGHGVRELWVIDAARNRTHVHRDPGSDQWGSIEILSARDTLRHPALPGLSVRLDGV